jgi:mRNA-degrading endonuclease RelE of RelBE toxin-antitoxin system
MEFVETSTFTKLIYSFLSDDEYVGLQGFMFMFPEAGDFVPGSGGVRKLRWATTGRGKRGGVRVIYYFKKRDSEIWMLTIYGKNQVENIPAHILRLIVEEVKNA